MRPRISRRTVLRGLGVAVGLPWLEAMAGAASHAKDSGNTQAPLRLLWLHTESGMLMEKYKPTATGPEFELTPTLQPLARFKSRLSVLSGLYHENAFKRNPQTGRHVQDTICHLTGADLSGTPGVAVRNSISVDQLAAQSIGEQTRIPVLNLSPSRSGYLSFSPGGSGIPNQWNPRLVFTQLFADASPEARLEMEKRFREKKSILDGISDETRRLESRVSSSDRQKLEEYLTHVRDVERRLKLAERWAALPPVPVPPGVSSPQGDPPESNRRAHIRLLMDMLVLALQTDQTRLATLQVGFMNCRYPEDGLSESYHFYTHSDGLADRLAAMGTMDRLRIEHLAYLLDKLDTIQEGGTSLLHHCVVHYGSGMGSWHESTDIANLVVGDGGGRIKSCGHKDFGGAPLSNLYVRMLQLAGVNCSSFADSTGPLDEIMS